MFYFSGRRVAAGGAQIFPPVGFPLAGGVVPGEWPSGCRCVVVPRRPPPQCAGVAVSSGQSSQVRPFVSPVCRVRGKGWWVVRGPGQRPGACSGATPQSAGDAVAMVLSGLSWLADADMASVPASVQADCLVRVNLLTRRFGCARLLMGEHARDLAEPGSNVVPALSPDRARQPQRSP